MKKACKKSRSSTNAWTSTSPPKTATHPFFADMAAKKAEGGEGEEVEVQYISVRFLRQTGMRSLRPQKACLGANSRMRASRSSQRCTRRFSLRQEAAWQVPTLPATRRTRRGGCRFSE